MANKGTQGIFKSDVTILRELTENNISISVSTTDINGVKQLGLSLDSILPSMVDIPYEKADAYAKKNNYDRDNIKYKLYAIQSLIFMFFQASLSVLSAILLKLGLTPFYRKDVLENIKNSNLIISGSDEIFKETSSLLSFDIMWLIIWWSMLFSRTWDVLIAKFIGKNLVMFPNSVGPFKTFIGRNLSKLALNNYDYVCVREPVSYNIVNSMNLSCKKILTSDIALLLPLNADYCIPMENSIGVCPGVYEQGMPDKKIREYINAHAIALDMAIEKYDINVVFIPHYISGFKNDDLSVSEMIINNMKYKNKTKFIITNSVDEFKSLLNRMNFVISSKMHPAVYATSEFTPTLCIAYDHKQTGFFKDLNLSNCVIPISDVTARKLWSKVEYIWNDKINIHNELKKIIPILKQKEKEDIRKVLHPYIFKYKNDERV